MSPLSFIPCRSLATITTPLNVSGWYNLLRGSGNWELAKFFLTGISEGFRIEYRYGEFPLKSARANLHGAHDHPEVVDRYLDTEIAQGRMIGPFPLDSLPGSHISRFGVIPKGHQVDKWRLIVDLSYPAGSSVNDGIPKFLCSIRYISIDDAIESILKCGTDTLLAKSTSKMPLDSFLYTPLIDIC